MSLRRQTQASVEGTRLGWRLEPASFLVALALLLQWGLPLIFVGIPAWISIQAYSVFFFLAACWRLVRVGKYGSLDAWEIGIIVFMGYCYFVTIVASSFIFGYGISEWTTATIYIFPLLFIFVARVFDVKVRNILAGFVIATSISASLIIIDRIAPIAVFSDMLSRSTLSNTSRRIVLMHNESAFAMVILVGYLAGVKRLSQFIAGLIPLLMIGFSLVIVSESRLALGATMIGIGIFFFVVFRHRMKPVFFALGVVVLMASAPFLFSKYIDSLEKVVLTGRLDELTSQEETTRFRVTEIGHFENYFDMTNGFGFGLLTISPNKENFLSRSMFALSVLYDVDSQMGLVDIRMYAALYQFGYVGLACVLFLTVLVGTKCIGVGRRRLHPQSQMVGAVGCVTLAYLISPIPANLFTVDNTVLIGGLIYALTALALREEAALRGPVLSSKAVLA